MFRRHAPTSGGTRGSVFPPRVERGATTFGGSSRGPPEREDGARARSRTEPPGLEVPRRVPLGRARRLGAWRALRPESPVGIEPTVTGVAVPLVHQGRGSQSGRRESNPRILAGSEVPSPFGRPRGADGGIRTRGARLGRPAGRHDQHPRRAPRRSRTDPRALQGRAVRQEQRSVELAAGVEPASCAHTKGDASPEETSMVDPRGVEPALRGLQGCAARPEPGPWWRRRESNPEPLPAEERSAPNAIPMVDPAGVEPASARCERTLHTRCTSPWQAGKESNLLPEFWRLCCALRSGLWRRPPVSNRLTRETTELPRQWHKGGKVDDGSPCPPVPQRLTRRRLVSSPRVERGPCALGVRRPLPAGRGDWRQCSELNGDPTLRGGWACRCGPQRTSAIGVGCATGIEPA